MSIKDLSAKAWYWKMAFWKGIIGVVIIGLTSAMGTISSLDWLDQRHIKMTLFVMGVVCAMLKGLDMLIDTTIATLKQNQQDQTTDPKSPSV